MSSLSQTEGSVVGEKSFRHSGTGLFEMARWIQEASGSDSRAIAVAIEVNHGPVVENLCEQGFMVYSINPKQFDLFRDRFSVSGAKDDRKDALVLASALRTDHKRFRHIEPQNPDVIVLREFTRTREELLRERKRTYTAVLPKGNGLWKTDTGRCKQSYGQIEQQTEAMPWLRNPQSGILRH